MSRRDSPDDKLFVVFDLDGTLADDSHRHHFITGETRDWDSYYANVGGDAPVEPLVRIARVLGIMSLGTIDLEIWTGRPERFRAETAHWLKQHRIRYLKLRMRMDNDHRPVNEVKGEWLDEGYYPDIIFDDRTKACEFWRSKGIICAQVAQHDY